MGSRGVFGYGDGFWNVSDRSRITNAAALNHSPQGILLSARGSLPIDVFRLPIGSGACGRRASGADREVSACATGFLDLLARSPGLDFLWRFRSSLVCCRQLGGLGLHSQSDSHRA